MIYAQHFTQEEFREWADDVSPRLVTMLAMAAQMGLGDQELDSLFEAGSQIEA